MGRGFPLEVFGNEVAVTAAQHRECIANPRVFHFGMSKMVNIWLCEFYLTLKNEYTEQNPNFMVEKIRLSAKSGGGLINAFFPSLSDLSSTYIFYFQWRVLKQNHLEKSGLLSGQSLRSLEITPCSHSIGYYTKGSPVQPVK